MTRARGFATAKVATAVVAVAVGLAACGGGGSTSSGDAAGEPAPSGPVTVFAAASLTESFERIARDFERAQPRMDVKFNFGASSALAQQIVQGAPADVFAAASPTTMRQVTDAGQPTVFARNRLQIAVPKGNPGHVTGLADFAKPQLKIALCAPQVPCGAAALKAFDAAHLTPKPDTLEQDVKAALTKVKLGEVDAALVYRTDVRSAAGTVQGIEFPEAGEAINDYPIVVLQKAPNAAAARAFVDHVLSQRGRTVLTWAGFELP